MFMDIDAIIFETVSIRNDVDKDPYFNPSEFYIFVISFKKKLDI